MNAPNKIKELNKFLYAKNCVVDKVFHNFIQLEFQFDSNETILGKSSLIHDYLKCLNELNMLIRQSTEKFQNIYNGNNSDIEKTFLSIGCGFIIIFIEKYLYISKKIQSLFTELNMDSKSIKLAYEEKQNMYEKYRVMHLFLSK